MSRRTKGTGSRPIGLVAAAFVAVFVAAVLLGGALVPRAHAQEGSDGEADLRTNSSNIMEDAPLSPEARAYGSPGELQAYDAALAKMEDLEREYDAAELEEERIAAEGDAISDPLSDESIRLEDEEIEAGARVDAVERQATPTVVEVHELETAITETQLQADLQGVAASDVEGSSASAKAKAEGRQPEPTTASPVAEEPEPAPEDRGDPVGDAIVGAQDDGQPGTGGERDGGGFRPLFFVAFAFVVLFVAVSMIGGGIKGAIKGGLRGAFFPGSGHGRHGGHGRSDD